MLKNKVVYIAGPVTGVDKYWEAFERAEDDLTALGCIPLSPARLPEGMTKAQYMRICFSMIDSADAVLFLTKWTNSDGANVEHQYCKYIGKPTVYLQEQGLFEKLAGTEFPREVTQAWLKHDLEEVFKA